jgi:SAM-dependent methyltransferase
MAEALDRMASARNYNAWLAGRARPYVGERVLELGAGIGTIAELLAKGSEVVALEPDQELVAELRRRAASTPSLTVVDEDAETYLGRASEAFDSVVCMNVLEHIEAEAETLRGCRSALVPGGHLLLLVPAHASLFGAVDEMGGHVRRYDAPHLRRALTEAGFDVVDLRHVNPVGALGWLVVSRLLRRDQVPRGPLVSYDRLVPLLRQLDRLRLPFGLSLWAVARRPSTSS